MKFDFYIGGKFGHSTNKFYSVLAKEDLSEIASIPDAGAEDVNNAAAAAKKAYDEVWKYVSGAEKERLLLKMADIMDRRADEIGKVLGRELGRYSRDTANDVRDGASMIRFYAGMCEKMYGDVLEAGVQTLNYVIKQPFGAVGCMPAWNFPFTGAVQKFAPALAAGNTVVLKCADEAPLATIMFGEIADEAGFPAGVFNVISGLGPESGKAMTANPDLKMISFTGSVAVGKLIMTACVDTMKRVVLELGGKSPFIVFEDADIDRAAELAAEFGFFFQGQLCCAASRVLVQNSVKEKFIAKYLEHIAQMRPGYPEDRASDPMAKTGPLFNERQYNRIEEYVRYGKENAKLLAGGKRVTGGKFDKAYYYEPTVFYTDDCKLRISREEIFGPIVTIIGFDKEQDAVRIANDVDYGLSSSVWTSDIGRVHRMTKHLEFGTVWVNEYLQFSNSSPWGGFKSSGMGREYGVHALESYYDHKNIWVNPSRKA